MEQEISTITGGSLVITLCLGILLLMLPRRYALLPLMISGCYMTLGQVLLVGPFHFTIFRILILFGLIRIVIRGEVSNIKLNSIDKVLIALILVSFFLFILLRGTSGAVIYKLGQSYNALGTYFFIRALVRDYSDMVQAVKMLGIIMIPLAVLFLVEMATGRNMFSVFGGVPEITGIREGRLRCQGPFEHPILAGTFGATAMPLFVGLWSYDKQNRRFAAVAFVAATVIVIASSSSGPLLAYVISVIGLFFWAYRSKMKSIRRGIVFSLVALHLIMKAPVWFLIARIGDVVGGGGWYRAALIDAAIRHFNEWWLMGTAYTAHWMPTGLSADPNNTDITNQFIAVGVGGGLISMILFIWLVVKCFKAVGLSARNEALFSRPERFLIWSVGCALLGHIASFFSVSYFDQIIIFWYMVVAMTAMLLGLNPAASTIRNALSDRTYNDNQDINVTLEIVLAEKKFQLDALQYLCG
jgi:hypothetical protein